MKKSWGALGEEVRRRARHRIFFSTRGKVVFQNAFVVIIMIIIIGISDIRSFFQAIRCIFVYEIGSIQKNSSL